MDAKVSEARQQTESPKREAILEAALERFAELGVNGVAVPDIAALAQVGTGTIYRYFDSKEALVNELFRREKKRYGAYLGYSENPQAEPAELFREHWHRMVGFAREHPKSFRFLELQDHLPYLDQESRDLEREVLRRLAAPPRYLQEQGTFRNDIRAEIIMATIWGAFVNLMKAERAGYFELTEQDIIAARDACWRMCATRP